MKYLPLLLLLGCSNPTEPNQPINEICLNGVTYYETETDLEPALSVVGGVITCGVEE